MAYKAANPAEIKQKIKSFIDERFMQGAGMANVDDGDSFLENGIIDSTGILELVTFSEETFAIEVDDEEMIPDNLDSLDNLTQFIQRKLQAG